MPTSANLLDALIAYLQADAPIAALVGGRIYADRAIGTATYPYVVIDDYEEDSPGETLDDMQISLCVSLFHSDQASLRTLSATVKAEIDTPGTSPTGLRTTQLAWTGGSETGLVRFASRPRELARAGPGATHAWREDIRYVFWATPSN